MFEDESGRALESTFVDDDGEVFKGEAGEGGSLRSDHNGLAGTTPSLADPGTNFPVLVDEGRPRRSKGLPSFDLSDSVVDFVMGSSREGEFDFPKPLCERSYRPPGFYDDYPLSWSESLRKLKEVFYHRTLKSKELY